MSKIKLKVLLGPTNCKIAVGEKVKVQRLFDRGVIYHGVFGKGGPVGVLEKSCGVSNHFTGSVCESSATEFAIEAEEEEALLTEEGGSLV